MAAEPQPLFKVQSHFNESHHKLSYDNREGAKPEAILDVYRAKSGLMCPDA
jgi:hypothetical protein